MRASGSTLGPASFIRIASRIPPGRVSFFLISRGLKSGFQLRQLNVLMLYSPPMFLFSSSGGRSLGGVWEVSESKL